MSGQAFLAGAALLTDAALLISAGLLAKALLIANVALLTAALLVRFPVGHGAGRDLRPTEVALLRSGPRAAVVTALVLLHARAAVDVAAPGAVRRSGALPHGCDPLARLVYESLARPGGPRELAARGPVRGGLDRLAAGLAGAGLVLSAWRRLALRALATLAALVAAAGLTAMAAANGLAATGGHRAPAIAALIGPAVAVAALALLPARTVAGRRLVRRLRWRHAHLTPDHEPDAAEWSPQVLGLAVALHGEAALRLTFPRFAAQGGLLGRRAPGGRSSGGRGPGGPEGPARQWPHRGRAARQRQRGGRPRNRSNLPPAGARRSAGPISPGS